MLFFKPLKVHGRACGECTACCIYLDIDVLSKPKNVPCKHLAVNADGGFSGCGIYETRPTICHKYACMWKQSNDVPEWLRPDLSGVLVQATGFKDAPLFYFTEIRENAISNPKLQQYIRAILDNGAIVFLINNENRQKDKVTKEEITFAMSNFLLMNDDVGFKWAEKVIPFIIKDIYGVTVGAKIK